MSNILEIMENDDYIFGAWVMWKERGVIGKGPLHAQTKGSNTLCGRKINYWWYTAIVKRNSVGCPICKRRLILLKEKCKNEPNNN